MSGGTSLSAAAPLPSPPLLSPPAHSLITFLISSLFNFITSYAAAIFHQFHFHRHSHQPPPPLGPHHPLHFSNRRPHLGKQAHPSLIAWFWGGYYHMIISDGQLATKMFH